MNRMSPLQDTDPRWQAVLGRDPAAAFVYGVTSTGIYCRPACPSRRPSPANVRFFDDPAAAETAGFRACLRCRPDQADRHAALVAQACRAIEDSDEAIGLDALAGAAGLSPFHFHRLFKARTGVTPKAYADACRARRASQALDGPSTVTEALYEAGYGSSGRFYARSTDRLGMIPTRYRAGGAGETIRFALGQCSLGAILVAATPKGICAITLGDEPEALLHGLQARFHKAELIGGDAEFERWVAQVIGFVEAPRLGLDLPLDIRGTAFQQRVWQALREIPPGETLSYTEVAQRLGLPKAVRAVASACAANPIALAIPCHRVRRIGGALAGYRWGLARKQALLVREAQG